MSFLFHPTGVLTLQRNTSITKITLSPLQSGYRSSNALNANLDAIEAAIENTLSRDGTSPNQMEAVLDMNDNRIINLPEPIDGSDAARLTDVLAVAPGTGINTWLVTPSSANLAAAVTDETGTGLLVFNTSPSLTSPIITGGSFSGGTDIAVADGGTGASTAAGARTNLGLVIGTDVQAYSPNLLALAGLSGAADKLPYFTGASVLALTNLISQSRSFLADPDSQYVNFTAAGTGASTLTARTKMRQALHVKDFGVTADGTTDDTAALQAAINAAVAQVADLNFGSGTIIVSSTIDGTALAGARLFGVATIKGKSSTDFQYLLDISDTTDVTIDGLSFDANAAGRGSAAGKLSCLKANTTVFNRLLNLTCKNTLGLAGPTSSIAISASGGVIALYADGLVFKNLGTSATTKPSDGIFIRGDYCHITNTYGENVTDHVVVLEGCNYSIVTNTTCKNCTSFVAMSNDSATNIYGNVINGVSGTCNYFGSFGAALGIYTFSTGWISGCIITNVSVYGATGAAGGGPAVMISGRVEGSLSNLTLQPGGSTGVMNQAILINTTAGGRGITVSNSVLEVEGASSVIRIQGASDAISIINNAIREGAYGIYADGTSNFTVDGNRFVSQSTDKIGLGGSAYYYGDIWQNWTPTYSSSVGDAAATFTGTPTTTQAKIIRVGDTVTISLNFDATLLAVSPSYLALTVPSWAAPINNNQWTPANVLNDTTWETGEIRGITGGTFRIYRANVASFSANANVSCHVNFSYPVA